MNRHLILILVFAFVGFVVSGAVADQGAGLGLENLIGVVAGAAFGAFVVFVLPAPLEDN